LFLNPKPNFNSTAPVNDDVQTPEIVRVNFKNGMTKYARKLQENIEKKIENIRKSKHVSPENSIANYKNCENRCNPLTKKKSIKEKYSSMDNCSNDSNYKISNITDRIMVFDDKKTTKNKSTKEISILKVLNKNNKGKLCKNNAYIKQNGTKSQRNRTSSNTPEKQLAENANFNSKTCNNSIDRQQEQSIRFISQKNKSISAIKNFLGKKATTIKDSVSDAINNNLSKGNKKSNLIVNNKNAFNQNLIDNFNKYKASKMSSRNGSVKRI